ncbi:MAG TPA: energy transducer TonB [Telluria sp.]|nr:energy transducer TonB [Telluria sp.]
MSASFSPLPALGAPGSAAARLRAQFAPLTFIVVAHVLVLYGIYSGLLHRVVTSAMPAVVFVSYVAPPPPMPAPPLVTPAEVQTLQPPAVTAPQTVISIAPPENAIRLPAPAAPPAEKAAPAAAVAAAPVVAPAVPVAGPRTITSGVEYIRAPQPEYPALSKRLGEQGRVVLRILVDEQGLPAQVVVQTSSGFARLDEAGRQAALRALFKPHTEDGRPVAVFVIVPLNFQMAS